MAKVGSESWRPALELPMTLALRNGPEDPSLHDPEWRAFILACEANSEEASRNWGRYRLGIRRLRAAFHGRVPKEQMERELAVDVFVCACWYCPNGRIVRAALRELLARRLGVSRYLTAAAEYWKWAQTNSADDLLAAERMIELGRPAMQRLEIGERQNLERMLKRMVGKLPINPHSA